jgi:flagellin-like hook-associated protein FlgL
MKVNNDINLGNVVSWTLILLGFAVSYTRLQGEATIAKETAKEAVLKAESAEGKLNAINVRLASIDANLSFVTKNVEEIKQTIKNE